MGGQRASHDGEGTSRWSLLSVRGGEGRLADGKKLEERALRTSRGGKVGREVA